MSRRWVAGFVTASYNPFLVPDAPTSVIATAGSASASVAFTAPSNVGGGSITSYTVISSGGQITTGTSSPIVVTGLTNGTSYTFTVFATNAYGSGPRSAASNSVTPAAIVSIDYLVVAGGGGSTSFAGGGGGGGVLAGTTNVTPSTSYTITVGAGASPRSGLSIIGFSGSNSTVSGTGVSLTAIGGGGGASRIEAPPYTSQNGASGGSGGGGSPSDSGPQGAGGAGTSGQGFAGGNGASSGWGGGGGGGGGAVGGNASGNTAGNGGAGFSSSISSSATFYAGGGGGSTYNSNPAGSGGSGGGGAGAGDNSSGGTSGTANTGGGGGGGSYPSASGGGGGSGVVIISATQVAASTTGSPSLVYWPGAPGGGRYIYTFTSSGSITY